MINVNTKRCSQCIHSKFDGVWGEFKCLYFSRRIHDLETEAENCEHYEKIKD